MQAKQGELSRNMLPVFRVLFTLCLIATVLFIFSNSAQWGEVSGGRSQAVTQWLSKVMDKLGLSFSFSEHLVRKLAHFAEYALLGFWLVLTLRVYTRRFLAHISWPLFFGLLVPVLDESFQLLIPGRSGQVLDIVIDFAGVLGGLCCGLFVLLLFRVAWYGRQERKNAQ